MKKKLALLLSALMVVTAIPATAFAVTTNTMSKIVSGSIDADYTNANAPILKFEDKNLNDLPANSEIAFKLTLENAEWFIPKIDTDKSGDTMMESGDVIIDIADADNVLTDAGSGNALNGFKAEALGFEANSSGADETIDVQMVSAKQIIVTVKGFQGTPDGGDSIVIPMLTTLTDEGEARVTVDPMESVLTAGTYKFANVIEGATVTTIDDTVAIKEGNTTLKAITIEEVVADTIKTGTLKLKLSGDYTWNHVDENNATPDNYGFVVYPANSITLGAVDVEDETMEIAYTVDPDYAGRSKTITFTGLSVKADFDDVEVGEICELTISGNGIDKQTLEVGTATDYSVALSAENKTVPTFYAGRVDEDTESLKVTIKENIEDSWIMNRKTVLTFPDGVKVLDVEADSDNINNFDYDADANEVKFDTNMTSDGTGKAKVEMTFKFSINPRFEGDIVAKLSGAGVDAEQEVVVGTVVSPITVTAETNKVSIDYRNVAIGDIMIEEAYAGALQKGKTLSLQLNTISFDGDPTVEVVEGDIEIDEVNVDGGKINITIDSESAKTPATLKVTNIELFLDRSLPAGDYSLKIVANDTYPWNQGMGGNGITNALEATGDGSGMVNESDFISNKNVGDAYFQNSAASDQSVSKTVLFDVRNKTVLSDYVEVVTAGRDQDDSTFTTKIQVTIGSNTMVVGDADKALDVPAYISNGYTMMPVRAVTEALSGSAIVRWDDPTKTVTITFGSRVISMSVGSSSMLINGVPVQMQAAVEITGERAFIPLRDLGYALGLNDSKIAWDDATKTATLN